MSFIALVVIKGKRLSVLHLHYREALELIANDCKDISPLLDLDEGYLVLDYNTKTALNSQYAIPVILPGWTYLEI